MASNLKRIGSFHHVASTERVDQASKVTGIGKGGLLEFLVLGMTDEELVAAVTKGRKVRDTYPDARGKERGVLMSKVLSLSNEKLEKLLETAEAKQ